MSVEIPEFLPADLPPTRTMEEVERDPELTDRHLLLIYAAQDIKTRRPTHAVLIGATEPVTMESRHYMFHPFRYVRQIPCEIPLHLRYSPLIFERRVPTKEGL